MAVMYGLVDVKPMDPEAALALDDRPDRAVLELDDLGDLGERADVVQLRGLFDLLLLGLALGDEGDGTARADGGIERVDALLAADLERHDHLGEDDRLAEGDEGQLCRPVGRDSAAPAFVFLAVGCGSSGLDGRSAIRFSCQAWRAFPPLA